MNRVFDTAPALLSLNQLSKRYAVTVLDRVTFDVQAGEIHALIGANGAGKSTLCRIVAGLTPASDGSMSISGKSYAPANKAAAEQAGVQIVQQELNLLQTMTVAENVLLNRLPHRFGCINYRQLNEETTQALQRIGLTDIRPDESVGSLGVGQQQMIEIAATLYRGGRVLILDEPTAALSAAEVEKLFQQLKQLRQAGLGIIYISHRLDEIAEIADRVTLLRDGRWVATEPIADLPTERMISLMTGDDTSDHPDHIDRRTEQEALRVERITRLPAVNKVSFTVRRGECFGIAGLVGSGRTELLRAIFGADPADAGAVYLHGQPPAHQFRQPRQAIRHRMGMVTEDRKQNGLLLSQSIGDNSSLCSMSQFSRHGVVQKQREDEAAEHWTKELDIRCRNVLQTVGELSGGNQQKVAIAKWLQRDADILLFDEPTRGIDIGARRRIYQLLDTLAAEGKSLVIVSSDTDELMQTCDTIAVMSAGRLVATFDRDNWSRAAILQAAFQGYLVNDND